LFVFFSCFAFYLITCQWSYSWVLTTSLGFAGALFFSSFFHWFFSWFHYPTFWFLRIDDHYRVVDIFFCFLKYNNNTWAIVFCVAKKLSGSWWSAGHLSSFYPKQGLKIGECSFPSQIEIGISLGVNVRNAH